MCVTEVSDAGPGASDRLLTGVAGTAARPTSRWWVCVVAGTAPARQALSGRWRFCFNLTPTLTFTLTLSLSLRSHVGGSLMGFSVEASAADWAPKYALPLASAVETVCGHVPSQTLSRLAACVGTHEAVRCIRVCEEPLTEDGSPLTVCDARCVAHGV